MPVIPITTGPVDIWVKCRTSASGSLTINFFGYGVVAPQSQIFYRYVPVKSDRTGPLVPRDKMAVGQEAFVFVEMSEWDEKVRELLSGVPNTARNVIAPGSAGTELFGDMGTLMVTEGFAYTLYVRYPFAVAAAGHPAMVAQPLVAGYRFFGVTGEQQKWQPGTQPNVVTWQWHSIMVPPAVAAQGNTAQVGATNPTGTWVCYDHNLTEIGSPPPPA